MRGTVFGGYRRTAVLHLEYAIIGGSLDADFDASPAVNDRVADEIRNNLRQAVRIPGARNGVTSVHDDLRSRMRGAQLVDSRLNDLPEVRAGPEPHWNFARLARACEIQ